MRRFVQFFQTLISRRAAVKKKRSPRPRARLQLEPLEERSLLSTLSGTVGGTLFVDGNGNGFEDAGEPGLPGVNITLAGVTGSNSPVNVVTTSDANGNYSFQNVLPGNYHLIVGSAPGFGSVTTNLSGGFALGQDQTFTQNVAFGGLQTQSLSLRQFTSDSTSSNFPFQPGGQGTQTVNPNAVGTPIVSNQISNITVNVPTTSSSVDLAGQFAIPGQPDTEIRIDTSDGPININLLDSAAPQTVANFLDYVQSGAYNSSIFHRLVSNFVIQGGGFAFSSTNGAGNVTSIPTLQPVPGEFGTSNTIFTVAMALSGSDPNNPSNPNPNSGTDQFFFNLADNSSSLDSQKFTVFGTVTDSASQQVLMKMATTPILDESSFNSAFNTIPLNNYQSTDKNFPTDTTAANYLIINDVAFVSGGDALSYSVVGNTNPSLVTPSLVNERLNLNYASGQTGTATITVQATDQFGTSIQQSFNVTVNPAQPPTATVSLNNNNPLTTGTVTATATTTDPNSLPVNLTYNWTVNGAAVKTTSSTQATTDTLDLSTIPGLLPGAALAVTVTPSDSLTTGTPVTANATVIAGVPTATVSLLPASPASNGTVTAAVTTSDPNMLPVSLTYTWTINGTTVQTTSDTMSLADILDLSKQSGVVSGTTISVSVLPSDSLVTGTAATATATVA